MSDVQYVISVIVYEDGHSDVIWDSSVSTEACYAALKQITNDMEDALGNNNPPPKPTKSKPSNITRLK